MNVYIYYYQKKEISYIGKIGFTEEIVHFSQSVDWRRLLRIVYLVVVILRT